MERTSLSKNSIPVLPICKQLTLFSLFSFLFKFSVYVYSVVLRLSAAAGGDLAIDFTSIHNKTGRYTNKNSTTKEAQSALPMCFQCDAANLVPALCYSSTDRRLAFAGAQSEDCIPSRYPIFTDGRTVGFVDHSVVTPVRSSRGTHAPAVGPAAAFLPRSDSELRWYDDTLRICTHGFAAGVDTFRLPHQKETHHF